MDELVTGARAVRSEITPHTSHDGVADVRCCGGRSERALYIRAGNEVLKYAIFFFACILTIQGVSANDEADVDLNLFPLPRSTLMWNGSGYTTAVKGSEHWIHQNYSNSFMLFYISSERRKVTTQVLLATERELFGVSRGKGYHERISAFQ